MNVIARKPTLARHNVVSRYSNNDGLGKDNSGSGMFDWNNLVDGIVDIGKTFVSSFWNKGDAATANALNEMYDEQKKTTYILFGIIGIVLVLAAVVIIKKK